MRRFDPDTLETRLLRVLAEQRRRLVDDQTRVSNRMTSWLKIYFPQALNWIDDIDSPMGCDFLERWTTLEELQRTKPNVLHRFFVDHNSRSEERIQERIRAIYDAKPAITDSAMLESGAAVMKALVRQARALAMGIAEMDERIDKAVQKHPDAPLFRSFPGVGPVVWRV